MAVALVACDDDESNIADNTKYYDEITKSLKLEKDYEGKSFLADGIGTATVAAYTDGDTTRFLTAGGTVIIRYYCIDTPESTGAVEKWGKAASLFVKEKLSNATLIVLESSTGGKPEHDSYGSRYLGYVWYKTAEDADLKNLNLELIENGFTENKAINTPAYPYYNKMNEANKFARSIELRIYSKLDDPLYSTDPIEITIKDFWDDIETYYNAESDSGAKVVFEAYLSSVRVSTTYTYTAVQYDPQTGEKYEINVYAGYSSSSATTMKLGHLYKILGSIQYYNGAYQVSGIVYNNIYQDKQPDGSYIAQRNYYLTFDSSEAYIDQYSATLYTNVTVTSISQENNVLTIVGTTQKRTASGVSDTTETYTFKVAVDDGYTSPLSVGSKFAVRGYQLVANSHEITISNVSDIIKK